MVNPNTSHLWTTEVQARYNTSQIKPLFRELRMKGDFLNNLKALNGMINLIKSFRLPKYKDLVGDGYASSGMMREDFVYFFHSGESMGKFLNKTTSTGQRVLAEFQRVGLIERISGPHRRSSDPNRRKTLWALNRDVLLKGKRLQQNLQSPKNASMGLMDLNFIKPTKPAETDSLNPRIYSITHPYRITHITTDEYFYEVSICSTSSVCRKDGFSEESINYQIQLEPQEETSTTRAVSRVNVRPKGQKKPSAAVHPSSPNAAPPPSPDQGNKKKRKFVDRTMIGYPYPTDGTKFDRNFFEEIPEGLHGPRPGIGYLPFEFVEDMEELYQRDEFIYHALGQTRRTDIGADEVRQSLEKFQEFLSITKPKKLEYNGKTWTKLMNYFVKVFLNTHKKVRGIATYNGDQFFSELSLIAEVEDYRGWKDSQSLIQRMLVISDEHKAEMIKRGQDFHNLVCQYYVPCDAAKWQAGLTTIDYAYLIARWGTKSVTLKMLKKLPLFMSGESFYNKKSDMLAAIENAYQHQVKQKGLK